MARESLDLIPLWLFLPLAIAIGMSAVECGYRYGRRRHLHGSGEKDSPVAAMVAAIFGLLAFMLAFTFSLAAGRFDARRQAVLEESNAIGTTYLRARFLPEPQRSEIMGLLRTYAEVRAQGPTAASLAGSIARSEELQGQIWSRTVGVAEKNPASIMAVLFVESLNEMIDLHSKRLLVGLRSRIPAIIWLVLFGLAFVGLSSVGYQAGLTGMRRSPEMPVLTLAFAAVLFLIVDLDRSQEGLLRVSQQSMIDLRKSMDAARP